MLEIVQCPIRVLPREPAELSNLILGNLQPSLSGWEEMRVEQFGQTVRDAPCRLLEAHRLDESNVVPQAGIQLVDDPATERPAVVDEPVEWVS